MSMTTPVVACPECNRETAFEPVIEDGAAGRPCDCGDPASVIPAPSRVTGYHGVRCGCVLTSGTWNLTSYREGDTIVVSFSRASTFRE